ncbi:MAG TPA: thiol reductant ABC exporter subunit CydC [Gaiellaceae bacterium]|nr:thiol reductant ABC exporter subunit CydC [Gaiellaceae bacterium]
MSPLARVLRLAAPLRPRFAVAILLGALALGAGVALMSSSGYLISHAALRPEILSLSVVIAAVRFFALARAVLRYLERLVAHDAAFRFLAHARVDFFRRLEPLVPGGLTASRPGELLSGFVADVDALQHLLVRVVGPPLAALAVGAAATLTAAVLVPEAGLALGISLVAGAIVVPLLAASIARTAGRRRPRERAELAGATVELLAGLPELVAYGAAAGRLAELDAADRRLRRSTVREALAGGAGDGLATALTGVAAAAVLAAAIPAVSAGRLDGVHLGLLALLALASFEGVRTLPLAAQHLAGTEAAAERLFALADTEPPVRDPRRPRRLEPGAVLRLEDARLRFGDGPWLLDGASLELRPGRRVALVGASGAGKTTLAHVLVRFRELEGGRATLDGHDLREYAQDDVRRVVALCGQDAHLFATTIRENVRLARPGATDAEIAAALRRAGAGPWLDSLPDGLDTFVGDEGGLVSGGQRQRIALARALLSGARLLILDEPTAHLDEPTAAAVLDDLLGAADDVGVLLITHSPLRLERFDAVLRLEAGRLAPAA